MDGRRLIQMIQAAADAAEQKRKPPAWLQALRRMAKSFREDDFDDAEILSHGIDCYIGTDRVHRRTLNALIQICAVSCGDFRDTTRRWTINEIGLAIAEGRKVSSVTQP